MNILYLTTHLNIGGISSYLLNLTQGMRKRGHTVYIASSGGELVQKFQETGSNFIPIPIKTKAEIHPKILLSFWKLRKLISSNNIEIIHANTRVTQVLACLLQRSTQVPFVSTCHGFFPKRLFRGLFPCWGVKIIAISEPVRDHLKHDFKIPEKVISVIHHGIDVDKFKAQGAKSKTEIKQSFGLSDCPVVGIIARLSDVKGHLFLIEAMQQVIEKVPEAQLFIVGSGKMQEELVDFTRQCRISQKVKFLPSVIETKEALSAMDLFVMPSLAEGLGLGLMEAMAAGLCVVGSYVGGIPDLIQDGHTGRLVKPRDIKELAGVIVELLGDSEKRNCLGANAQVFIATHFSQEKMAQETERLYRECLSAKI